MLTRKLITFDRSPTPSPSSILASLIGAPAEMSSSSSSSSSLPPASVPGPVAVSACAAMAVFYVAILYSPTVVLNLPPPSSIESFLIRRFICAAISSAVSAVACALLLGLADTPSVLLALGIRTDHMWQGVIFPVLLTSLLYAGTMVSKSFKMICNWKEDRASSCCGVSIARGCVDRMRAGARNVLSWRNYIVAPFTEELVFRACMIPLLLCGGVKTYKIIFFSPIFFSLAHLNHFMELYYQKGYNFLRAFMIVGVQLGYTVIFGWYAAFLFIRTGNLLSPIVAHVFCNVMGLPVLSSRRTKGAASIAFAAGVVGFFWLLFPITNPDIYNDQTESCSCWHGYCSWN